MKISLFRLWCVTLLSHVGVLDCQQAIAETLPTQRSATLRLEGAIDPSLGYRLRVRFTSQGGGESCSIYDYDNGMMTPKTSSYYIDPDLFGVFHTVNVSLVEPPGERECNWDLSAVDICIGNRINIRIATGCAPLIIVHPLSRMDNGPINVRVSRSTGVLTDFDGNNPVRTTGGIAGLIILNLVAIP